MARDVVRVGQSVVHGLRTARVARRVDAAVIVETHNPTSVAASLASLVSRRPFVLDDVTPRYEEERHYRLGAPLLGRLARRCSVRRADRLVTVSGSIRDALCDEGVPPSRIGIVPNGTAPALSPDEGAAWRADRGISSDRLVALYVGSFQPFHRVDLLVDALADPAAPASIDLVLVGDGETRPCAEEQVARLGLSGRVRFVGRVPSPEVPRVLAAADLAVLPATEEYMNPMKLYEYLGAGLTVVAPDQEAVASVVAELEQGAVVLFEPGSVHGLAVAIERASGMPRSAAPAAAHTWDDRADAMLEVLGAVTGARA